MEDIPSPVDHKVIIKLLDEFGVDHADTRFYSNMTEKIIGTENGFYTKPFHDYGTGIRIIHAGKEGYIGTNDYEELGFRASQLARALKSEEGGRTEYIRSSPIKSKVDISHENLINREYGGEASEFHKDIAKLLGEYSDIVFRYELENSVIQKEYMSTDNVHVQVKYMFTYFTLRLRLKEEGNRFAIYKSLGGVRSENLRWDSIHGITDNMVQELRDMSKAKIVKPGSYNALLSNDMAWTLIHETIGHGSEADGIINNQSFLSNAVGHSIASPLLTVMDDSQIKSGGWAEFDDEGTKATGTLIIEDGIFLQYLHTRKTAAIMETTPTGNARSSSYLSAPVSRQTNLYVQPQDMSEEELIEEVWDGLYIISAQGANVSIGTGDFHIIPQMAYRIEDGEITKPVLVNGIMGNAIKTLQSITAVGSMIEETPTYCYKNGTNLPVGMISPKIVVAETEVY